MKFNELSHMMQKPEPKPDTYEAGMALNQLLKIGTHAIKIHNMIDDHAEMESWVAKKIDLASNYVKSVHGYTAGSKAGTYDDDGMSEGTDTPATDKEIKMAKGIAFDKRNKDNMSKATSTIEKVRKGLSQQPDVADALKTANEDAGEQALANALATHYQGVADGYDPEDRGSQEHEEHEDIANAFKKGIQAGMDEINMSDFEFSGNDFDIEQDGRGVVYEPVAKLLKKYNVSAGLNKKGEAFLIKDGKAITDPSHWNTSESAVQEDAGEGHMSKSQLYATAKMSIELLDMINKGDDLEGWVQTKLNLAADYLQAVYHYEDYQKLNPYREELDGTLMQRHAGIIQKHLDEILERKCRTEDVDTKPGMMRILKKRVNEVEKEIAKENRKETNESTIKPYISMYKGKDGKQVYDVLDKNSKSAYKTSDQRLAQHFFKKNYHKLREAELEEGIKEWGKRLAMAGGIVAGLAGVNSINNAIDNSIPAVKAMNTALEMAQDSGNTELAKMIEKDLSDAKVRLSSGKDLSHVADMQDKYAKFMKTEGMAYESKLAVNLKQRLK